MPAKVELHSEAATFVQRCTVEEQDAFHARLREIRKKPIANSEFYFDPKLSRYLLRCFRFGRGFEKIAIFAYEIEQNRVRIIKCRLARPRRVRGDPEASAGDPP
jgi:hypothetical protein